MMSRNLLCIVLSVVFASAASAAMLENESFEELGDSFDKASGWNRWGDWINREDSWTPTHDGTCILAYHHWQIETEDSSGFWQDAKNIRPGKMYTFSVYANADPSNDGRANPDSVELRMETTLDGEQSTVASQTFRFDDIATGGDWSKLQVKARAPNDNLRVLVIMTPGKGGERGGALKFDSAAIVDE